MRADRGFISTSMMLAGHERETPAACWTRDCSMTMPSGMRILLVEDHIATLESLCLWLAARGYQVMSVCSIADACQVAREHSFQLLIADIGLPDGNGWELLAKLRPLGNFRAVAISGLAGPREHERSRAAGFSRLIEKPFDPAVLRSLLQEIQTTQPESLTATERSTE